MLLIASIRLFLAYSDFISIKVYNAFNLPSPRSLMLLNASSALSSVRGDSAGPRRVRRRVCHISKSRPRRPSRLSRGVALLRVRVRPLEAVPRASFVLLGRGERPTPRPCRRGGSGRVDPGSRCPGRSRSQSSPRLEPGVVLTKLISPRPRGTRNRPRSVLRRPASDRGPEGGRMSGKRSRRRFRPRTPASRGGLPPSGWTSGRRRTVCDLFVWKVS